jgi:lipopolysaccharide heptosyltransferase II
MDKILLVRLDHIGDLLMATPAIAALRRRFPEARIDLLGGERAKEIFRGNTDINHVHTFEATWYDPRRGKEIWPIDVVSALWKLRREKYDVCVDLRGDFRVLFLFLWLTGARRRIGFHDLGLGFLLTDSTSYDKEKNYLELNFEVLSPLNVDRNDPRVRFSIAEEEEDYIDKMFEVHEITGEDRIVGINPTTNRIEQRWSEKRFAELSDRLIDEAHVKVVLLSAETEASVARLVPLHMKNKVIDLVGKTNLGQLGVLMKKLSLYIANDSGPMHLSIALNTPTIGLFGTTSVQKSWPYNRNSTFFRAIAADVDCHRPCYVKDCDPQKCFDLISVDEVYEAAQEILSPKSGRYLEREKQRT